MTGGSAESASALAAAGNELGLTVTGMNVGFGILSKNIVNGAAGLQKYGITVRDAQGNILPFDSILGDGGRQVHHAAEGRGADRVRHERVRPIGEGRSSRCSRRAARGSTS